MKDWTKKTGAALLALALAAMISAGCGKKDEAATTSESTGSTTTGSTTTANGEKLTGKIEIDGSSTVFPIAQALTEEFGKSNGEVNIAVSEAGTGAGIKKFIKGELDIATASRPIEPEEADEAVKAGNDFIEVPIAFDGLSIVVNPKNTFLESITIDELHKIWDKDSKVKTWADVRAGFPATPLVLYGPTDSHGSFEYFNEAINKDKKNSRSDYSQCPDYNVLVQGVSRDDGALGYVGYAYFDQNKDQLKAIPVDAGKGAVGPSPETIVDGTYSPLSRPLFLYVSKKAIERPEVMAFVKFALSGGKAAIGQTGYIPLPDDAYALITKRVEDKKTGSVFAGIQPGMKIQDVLSKEQ